MKIIECPRDAMQGLEEFISTENKIRYLEQLLKVGFDTIDFGSFVSPKVIPQMRDTAAVLEGIQLGGSKTKLLSLSDTFQQRNTNKSIGEALNVLEEIKSECVKWNKKLVTYISMGFGNPYEDPYDIDLVLGFVDILKTLGSDIISLADTIGVSTPENIQYLFMTLSKMYPTLEIGAHLHSSPDTSTKKIEAAFQAGCKRFDGAIRGFGGCPMANDDLIGNLATENILQYLQNRGIKTGIDPVEFSRAVKLADEIFPKH
jgi:hydroxymethylglutaryl-CoA lyase